MAYEFNGTNQYLEVATAVANRPCTMAAWGYLDTTTGARDIVSVSSKTTTSVLRLNVNFGQYRIADQGNVNAVANGAIVSAGSWNHYAGVFASGSSRTPYTNGVAGAENTTSVAAITPTVTSIGAWFEGTSNPIQFFDGQIAEVGIWNAALTAAEIASLAKGMTCDKVRPQSLVFYAPLVRDLQDARGGLAITNNNAATVANHPRVYA
jgi:Concanavalin A-like lectin/glucanases superfamily